LLDSLFEQPDEKLLEIHPTSFSVRHNPHCTPTVQVGGVRDNSAAGVRGTRRFVENVLSKVGRLIGLSDTIALHWRYDHMADSLSHIEDAQAQWASQTGKSLGALVMLKI